MQHQKPFLAGILVLITGLFACDSNEIGDSKDVNQDRIYMDYRADYTEGDDDISFSLQYRFAGNAGTTLVLNEPSRVEMDGRKLHVDSSESGGAFYEVHENFRQFIGNHMITFTDINGKKFENTFSFAPFSLNAFPAAVDRHKDLVISFHTPLGPNDHVEINSFDSDSSFNYQRSGPDSSISIPAKELMRQKDKTLTLDCTLYREIPLLQTTAEGGSLKIYYRLEPVKIKLRP